MKILVESGATKSDWRILGTDVRFFLPGTNVSAMPMEAVKAVIGGGISRCIAEGGTPEGFFLYTAGVVTDAIRRELISFVKELASVPDVDIQDDLMGAARGACGHEKGIVAIMGTGSNACFFDGSSVSRNVYSGGFILGDDGSASVLGKLFIADFLKSRVPEAVAGAFEARFDASYSSIVENVYRGDSPSRYLGSFAPFIMEHYSSSEYVRNLVDNNFRAFAQKSLLAYDVASCPVGIVGGFGWACREIISRIFTEYGIRISRFIPAPIDGLIDYHR